MDQSSVPSRSRPSFLTVLCILSFIGIGMALIGYVASWFAVQRQLAMADAANAAFAATFRGALLDQRLGIIIGAAVLPFCLSGVVLMWRLKRLGLYLYAAAELAAPVSAIILVGFTGSGVQTATMLVGAAASVAFVVMYGCNLKHLQ